MYGVLAGQFVKLLFFSSPEFGNNWELKHRSLINSYKKVCFVVGAAWRVWLRINLWPLTLDLLTGTHRHLRVSPPVSNRESGRACGSGGLDWTRTGQGGWWGHAQFLLPDSPVWGCSLLCWGDGFPGGKSSLVNSSVSLKTLKRPWNSLSKKKNYINGKKLGVNTKHYSNSYPIIWVLLKSLFIWKCEAQIFASGCQHSLNNC